MESPHLQPRECVEAVSVNVEGQGFGVPLDFLWWTELMDLCIADIAASLTFACSKIVRANINQYTRRKSD